MTAIRTVTSELSHQSCHIRTVTTELSQYWKSLASMCIVCWPDSGESDHPHNTNIIGKETTEYCQSLCAHWTCEQERDADCMNLLWMNRLLSYLWIRKTFNWIASSCSYLNAALLIESRIPQVGTYSSRETKSCASVSPNLLSRYLLPETRETCYSKAAEISINYVDMNDKPCLKASLSRC